MGEVHAGLPQQKEVPDGDLTSAAAVWTWHRHATKKPEEPFRVTSEKGKVKTLLAALLSAWGFARSRRNGAPQTVSIQTRNIRLFARVRAQIPETQSGPTLARATAAVAGYLDC